MKEISISVPSERTIGIELRPAEPPQPRHVWWGQCRGDADARGSLRGYPCVTHVERDSAAFREGLCVGCTLISINNHSLRWKSGATIKSDFDYEKRASSEMKITFMLP